MQPPNRGFNRVAWLLPYAVAAVCLLGVAFTALRWSRRQAPAAAAAPAIDPELDARLENELRDLEWREAPRPRLNAPPRAWQYLFARTSCGRDVLTERS